MIQHVFERARASQAARVLIATDDERIRRVADGFGAAVVMTSSTHQSGTDRLQEAVVTLGLESRDIVVNVQGDEPLIPPAVIDQVARNLAERSDAGMATLCERIDSVGTFLDPNVVKLARDKSGMALYFSRAPIPWPRDAFAADRTVLPPGLEAWRHIGIYAYRVELLNQFVQWPAGELEQTECLEQLRAMHRGVAIHVEEACEPIPGGVDTEQDLADLRALLEPPPGPVIGPSQ